MSDPSSSSKSSRLPRAAWVGYAAFVLAVGLFQSLAEVQHYLLGGGEHAWEPFAWELTSAVSIGLLALGVYRWYRRLRQPTVRLATRVGGHLLGAFVFTLVHVAMMMGLRALIYAAAGLPYHPGTVGQVLPYEAAKDMVTYVVMMLISEAWCLFGLNQQRQRELSQVRAELAEAKLARLAEQIHPHFLFNTLSMVSSVMYEDLARADRILSDLASLLRQSLTANQSPLHTLADELRVVEPFLALMRERFGARLDVRREVSEAALECTIPSLLLMAPLENAVKHGVELCRGPAQVRLSAEVEGDTLLVCIEDSVGTPTRDYRPGGIGLANTRERLATLYGDQASVSLLARDGGGARLILRLPARRIDA
ncbi:MAG: histidine kinase [Tahibacter sp.]